MYSCLHFPPTMPPAPPILELTPFGFVHKNIMADISMV